MRILVYEYTCATGAAPALHAEGAAMLRAVTQDLAAGGMRPITLDPGENQEAGFLDTVARADGCLIIAPESGGILEERCRWVEDAGGRLLGSSAGVIAAVANKARLADHLAARGIHSPRLLSSHPLATDFPVIVKPRRGAGAQATFRADTRAQLASLLAKAHRLVSEHDFLVQSFVPGVPASATFLVSATGVVPLLTGRQHITLGETLTYHGGSLPLPEALRERALHLGRRVVAGYPGLRGYIGVDLVLAEARDGSQDAVIEINPRLTTSYLGLRRLARFNLAEAMVRVAHGETIPDPTWHEGRAIFRTDGTVEDEGGIL